MAAAETAFGGVVALREHFRCVPEIIQSHDRVTAAADELPGAIFWSGLGRERLALCEHGHQPKKMVAQQHAGRRLDVCIGVAVAGWNARITDPPQWVKPSWRDACS